MSNPGTYYVIPMLDDGAYLFSGTSGESMYHIGSYEGATAKLMGENRFNIRKLFPKISFAENFKRIFRALRGSGGIAESALKRMIERHGGIENCRHCTNCGYTFAAGSHTNNSNGVICPRCNAIGVRYNQKNLKHVIDCIEKYYNNFCGFLAQEEVSFDRMLTMIELVKEHKLECDFKSNQLFFSVDRIHFDRPGAHRFRRYANAEKWNEIFSCHDDGVHWIYDAGLIHSQRVYSLSDERFEMAIEFLSEHGTRLMGAEFCFVGDQEVVDRRRHAYIAERIASGNLNNYISDRIFNDGYTRHANDTIQEISAELMRRIPLNSHNLDGCVREDGSIDGDSLYEHVDPAFVIENVYDICCGNESCLEIVRDNIREEYRLA